MNNPEWSATDYPLNKRRRSSSSRRSSTTTDWGVSEHKPTTLKVVDIGLLLIFWLAPFFMAGRQAMGQLVLCILVTVTAIAWCVHQWKTNRARWSFTGVEPVILLGLGVIIFQCIEISPSLLNAVSPRVSELLPSWGTAGEEGVLINDTWQRVSFTPHDTWSNFIVIVACSLVFLILSQRIRTVKDVHQALSVVAVGGLAMALLAIGQFFVGNGKFFWFYEHPMTDTLYNAKGAFTNANHFANYLAMALVAQLYLVVTQLQEEQNQQSSRRPSKGLSLSPKLMVMIGAMALTGIAQLLSMSRGGIVVSMGGMTLALLILWRKNLLPTKVTALVGVLAIGCLGATLLFGDLAAKMIEQNFNELTTTDLQELDKKDGRKRIWEANAAGIQDFPILGTGLGSHSEVYWLWFNHPSDGKEYSHAENGYLQIALETGLIGIGIVVLLWLVALFWCLQGIWTAKNPQTAGAIAVITAALLISLVHSITDFIWYVPACVNVVLLFAVCAWRISLMRFSDEAPDTPTETAPALARFAWMGAAPIFAVLGFWMMSQKLPEVASEPIWHEYLRLSLASQKTKFDNVSAAETLLKRRIRLAIEAADADPTSQRIQLHAGLAHLKKFALHQIETESQMPLAQIREAARSAFQTKEEMDTWLANPGVLGEARQLLEQARVHFEESLRCCPLQPRPYLEIAELDWLQGLPEQREQKFVEQAVTVRPYDARTQFAMGTTLWTSGDMEQGLAHWQEAFRLNARYRGHLISRLSSFVPAQFFLDNFNPDFDSLKQLRIAYSESPDRRGYAEVIQKLSKAAVKKAIENEELDAVEEWLLAHECFVQLGDLNSAYKAAKEAIDVNPSSYDAHLTLGIFLFQNQAWREAVKELEWCYNRRPDKEWLRIRAEEAFLAAERGVVPTQQVAEQPAGYTVR